ncbi:hypothetical protein [Pseudomonas sp.]|jgi:hypothetical protein|uniref:hypothetical protein n=1 Tax=Pseudomonas sp. TaxID=306 RepID=UPI0028B02008|nr:hypothetical protein [Pseudomonas sp.]
MSETLELNLPDDLLQLLRRYHAHTGVAAQDYVIALLTQTRPTLEAVVEAFDEAAGDSEAVGRLFGSKMADVLREREATSR